jgi:esterase/lipase superfamily enzyme
MKPPDPDREHEYAAEADRLAQLPAEAQRQAVAIIRAPADNPKVGKRDREEARQRADALERHLRRLNRRKKKL